MKKKFREITVGNKTYGWTLSGGGKEHTITIWFDKKPINHTTVRTSYITPSMVKDIIVDNKLWEEIKS